MISTEKNALRAKYRSVRNNIKNRTELQYKIFQLIVESDLYKNSSAVFLYSSTGSEASMDSIIKTALHDGKKVALPLCIDKEGNMEFYFINNPDDLKEGMYGIKEPRKEKCKKAFSDKSTVCLVPGLSFDKEGGRLGYGKGYYDRFLSRFNGVSVGVCFESCLSEKLSLNKHDKKVDYLITDKKIYIFKMEEE